MRKTKNRKVTACQLDLGRKCGPLHLSGLLAAGVGSTFCLESLSLIGRDKSWLAVVSCPE